MASYSATTTTEHVHVQKTVISKQMKLNIIDTGRAVLQRKHAELLQAERRTIQEVRRAHSRNKSQKIIVIHLTSIIKLRNQVERNEILDAKMLQAKTDRLIFEDSYDMSVWMKEIAEDMKALSLKLDVEKIQAYSAQFTESENQTNISMDIITETVDTALEADIAIDQGTLDTLLQEILGKA